MTTDEQIATAPSAPTERRRRRLPRILGAVTVVALLGASVAYGVTQHGDATALTKQRDAARHSLSQTRKDLHTTQDSLNTTQSELNTATDQLAVCKDVGRATMDLFNASSSLTDALTGTLGGDFWSTGHIDDASRDVRRVTNLVHANGYETIQEFVRACTDGNGTGI